MVRMTSRVGTGVRERLVSAIDALCELTQDFTDSAYTTHHHREQVRMGRTHVSRIINRSAARYKRLIFF